MTEFIINNENAKAMFQNIRQALWAAMQSGAVSVRISRPSKSREQEKHYHALINEIAQQVTVYGKAKPAKIWKALLVDSFEREREEMGEPLRKPGQLVPSLDLDRLVSVRPSTTDFSKSEGAAFIEFLYAYGVEVGVKWSANAEQIAAAEREGAA